MAPLNTHTSKRILPALLLGCLLAVAPLAAQDRLFNRTDSLGRRSGLWRLSNSSLDSGFGYSFYYDGLKNGITIYFPGDSKPSHGPISLFQNGQRLQTLYFYDNGNIQFVEDSISVCTRFVSAAKKTFPGCFMTGEKILQAYIYCFDSNGYPVSEGWEFYPESSSFIADGTPAGTHIFYNPDGSSFTRLY